MFNLQHGSTCSSRPPNHPLSAAGGNDAGVLRSGDVFCQRMRRYIPIHLQPASDVDKLGFVIK